ncbi:GNAT family N-acetyltransferase [Rhodococcus sp. ABRD24]|uniref:GNAT family N-acetyltransferase n=1 Tax=Rhodococcus sp. ABRD24 TaxID=2507582 RepID=UPI001A95558D|nr:GNAT family N-acetyltransferase [Rhodococcus sp. ABRD24]
MNTFKCTNRCTFTLFESYRTEGRAWVWATGSAPPVAYCLVDIVDGGAHVEHHVAEWARDRGLPELTLTTFVDVPWNGPYYTRIGFEILATEDLGPGLRAVRDHEATRGLDRWPRVAMTRHVPIRP